MLVIGVDEAGRGPLVGSVVAAAVAFPQDLQLMGLLIPKSYLKKKERSFTNKLQECYWSWLNRAAMRLIKFNILEATMLAMKRAVRATKD